MRIRALLLAVAVLAVTAACGADEPVTEESPWRVACEQPKSTGTAPDFAEFTLACLSDETDYRLGDLDGRPRVITMWASWCGPCRAEAPAFKEFHERLGDQVDVVGVDTEDQPSKGRAFAADAGWKFPSVIDAKGAVMRAQGITKLPVTFFIDADGRTVATHNEGQLTIEKLEAAAERHFGVEP